MPILSFDDFINRIGGGYTLSQPWWGEIQTTPLSVFSGRQITGARQGWTKTLPSPLPTGVTSYIPSRISVTINVVTVLLVAKLIDLGSLSLATPTFTDGVAMPTVTELGVSTVTASAVLAEVTTVLNATPGSITITYVDQDGNTAETSPSTALTASSAIQSIGQVPLNAPDWGVRDITSATRTGGTTPTGVIQFWGIVPLDIFYSGPTTGVVVANLLGGGINICSLGAGNTIGIFKLVNSTGAATGDIFFVGDS